MLWVEGYLHEYLSLLSSIFCRKKPNLIVHLDVSPQESKRRIDVRSRECESTISLEYLTHLHGAYEEFIQDIARIIPVIRVNYEHFRTAEEMADMIMRCAILLHGLIDLWVWSRIYQHVFFPVPYREYAVMSSVRYVDFNTPENPPCKRETENECQEQTFVQPV